MAENVLIKESILTMLGNWFRSFFNDNSTYKPSEMPAVTPEQEAKGIVDNLEGYKIIIDEEKIMDDFDMIEYNSL